MTEQTTAVLETFAEHLRALELPLPLEGAEPARAETAAALAQLADHVAPRLDSLEAPLLVVVGGPTGAGKSTLVNALAGSPVSRAGAIRPTTRRPVLLHHPADEPWFAGPRILPGLARVRDGRGPGAPGPHDPADSTGSTDPATSLALHAEARIPRGIALLDAPDIDSIAAGNRELARQLLRAADLWLFVTTANRYADAVGWEVLRGAAERDVTVEVVMNRIPPAGGVAEELGADLRGLLERQGITAEHVFLIGEAELEDHAMLPPSAVAELREHLDALAADAGARRRIARRTLAGALDGLAASARRLGEQAAAQDAEREQLRELALAAFSGARERIDDALGDGSLLRGEVLARWQDVVGTGELLRGVEALVARARDRVGRMFGGDPAPAVAAEHALGTGLVHVVLDQTARGAERAESAWRATPGGRHLCEGRDLSRLPDGFAHEVSAEIRAWQGDVLELVRAEGADRRTKARLLSLGVNAVGVALMVVVFASTAFLPTGLEVGAGAAAAVVGQKLLETIFGDEAVRRMAATARKDLTTRLDALVAGRSAPFLERLDDLGGAGTAAGDLAEDAAALDGIARALREER